MKHSDYATRDKHLDLINDFEFMQWCDRQNDEIDHVKCREAALLCVNFVPMQVARKLKIDVSNVYARVRRYESTVKKYKRERR